jgi:PAS domain-containing protein
MARAPVTPSDVRVQQSNPLPEALLEAAFNALPTRIAILDSEGEIVYTNEAWRSFGAENEISEPSHALGVSYLGVCEGSDDEHTRTAAAGTESVLDGSERRYSFEYPCHGPNEKQWFAMQAIQSEHEGAAFMLVLHL